MFAGIGAGLGEVTLDPGAQGAQPGFVEDAAQNGNAVPPVGGDVFVSDQFG
jgi:hypothetical protein